MPSSPIVKLQIYGGKAVNKSASLVLSRKNKPLKVSKKAQNKLLELDALKIRRCAVCKITYQGTIVEHKLSDAHKKIKLQTMLGIK